MSDDDIKSPETEPGAAASAHPVRQSHRQVAEEAEEAFFEQASAQQDDDEDIDPELLRLPRPRRRRHPIIAVAVILLSAYMMFYFRTDFFFFFKGDDPVDLGQVAEAIKKGTIRNNAYVTVHGAPDRKHSVMLQGRISGYDSFYRLLQTNSRVFVQQARKHRTTTREVPYSHTGRVVPFSGKQYLQSLREHYSKRISTAHDLSFAAVKQALAKGSSGPAVLEDRLGQQVTIQPDTLVWINASFPREWVIQFSRKHYASDALARKQLAGIDMPFVKDDERSSTFRRFVVIADDAQVETLRRRFRDPALWVSVVRRQVSYTAKWSQLRFANEKLVIGANDPTFPARYQLKTDGDKPMLEAVKEKAPHLSQQEVLYTTVSAKFLVPDDAVVIVTRDRPSAFWHYLLLYVVLGAFIVFNAIALVSRLRALRPESVR